MKNSFNLSPLLNKNKVFIEQRKRIIREYQNSDSKFSKTKRNYQTHFRYSPTGQALKDKIKEALKKASEEIEEILLN